MDISELKKIEEQYKITFNENKKQDEVLAFKTAQKKHIELLQTNIENAVFVELSKDHIFSKKARHKFKQSDEFKSILAGAIAEDADLSSLKTAVSFNDIPDDLVPRFQKYYISELNKILIQSQNKGSKDLVRASLEFYDKVITEEVIRSAAERLCDSYWSKLISTLENNNIYFRSNSFNTPLSIGVPDEFFDYLYYNSYADENRQLFIKQQLGSKRAFNDLVVYDRLTSFVFRTRDKDIKYLQDLMNEYRPVRERVIAHLSDRLSDFGSVHYVLNVLSERLNHDLLISLLSLNPYISSSVEEYKERHSNREKLIDGILTAVPESLPEMYPLARQMFRHFIIHSGPTNSGKSHDAVEALKTAEHGVYLSPLRLLAFEKFEELGEAGVLCSMKTGEEEILVENSTVMCSTIEILNPNEEFDVAVIDEAQLLGDVERGRALTEAVLGIRADVIHICTAPEALDLLKRMISDCGDVYSVIEHQRFVPLELQKRPLVFTKNPEKGDCYIVFSRKAVHAAAAALKKTGVSCSMIYGALPYDVRRNEAKRFVSGDTDVVVATDAVGMGLNLPVKRICFLEETKFDGESRRELRPPEIKQISGRAGRYGIFEKGYVAVEESLSYGLFRNALYEKNEPVTTAYVGFPYSLTGIEGKLSDIMEQWVRIETSDFYTKASMEREIMLCRELEGISDNKELIYRFIMIPYDEEDKELHNLWIDMFRCVLEGEEHDYRYLHISVSGNLSDLEHRFRILDLMYYYSVNFDDSRYAEEIMEKKRYISSRISSILENRKPEVKRCRICGKELAWNYPYRLCRSCKAGKKHGKYGIRG